MKKQYILLSFVAALMSMMVVSCQKDQELVTLTAVMNPVNNPSKVYIDGYTPCWHNLDEVYVNDDAYTVHAASGSTAQIPNVTSSDNYCAVFPASIVNCGSGGITNNTSVPIELPEQQDYVMVDEYQRVDVPMGSYISSGSTLDFHNLCSIVRVTVSNNTTSPLPVTSITITANNAYLSGEGTASIAGQESDAITIGSSGSHSVALSMPGHGVMKEIGSLNSGTFDVVVPHFDDANQITIRVATSDGYQDIPLGQTVTLGHNTITTVTVDVTGLTQYTSATLVDGPTFQRALTTLSTTATDIRFEYNSSITSDVTLNTTGSTPIYLSLSSDNTTYVISTPADRIYANADCSHMFDTRLDIDNVLSEQRTINSIDFGDGFITDNVTDMSYMFYSCYYLASLDLRNFNTANVTTMEYMFDGCRTLTSLDLPSSFITDNVTNMIGTFCGCVALTSLDLSNFNTSRVTDMTNMFNSCVALTSLDLSSFNTSQVTSFVDMFSYCRALENITFSSNFTCQSVREMAEMFFECNSLSSIDLSSFTTSDALIRTNYMFANCTTLTSITFPSTFNTESVTDMSHMFQGCSALTSIYFPSAFNTSSVTDMSYMFQNCTALQDITFVDGFQGYAATNLSHMFENCSTLTSVPIPQANISTTGTSDMSYMFAGCTGLTGTLNVSGLDARGLNNMELMFLNCSHLTGINFGNYFNAASATNMRKVFSGCSSLTSLDLSHFQTSNVTNMSGMFELCYALQSITFSNTFTTGSVTTMSSMFRECRALTNLNLSTFTGSSELIDIDYMFQDCYVLGSLNLYNFEFTRSYAPTSTCYNLASELPEGQNCTITCSTTLRAKLESDPYFNTQSRITWDTH